MPRLNKTGQLVEHDFGLFVRCFVLEKMEVSHLVHLVRFVSNTFWGGWIKYQSLATRDSLVEREAL
jgi:hypothetical protein